jgi:transposase
MVQENTIPFTLPGFAIDQVDEHETQLVIQAHSTATQAVCPSCQQASTAIHSTYTRSPRDLPCSGRQVRLVLSVRRFRCPNAACQRQTFAERIPQVAPVHAQRTERLTTTVRALVFELSAEAGARVTQHLRMPMSGDTLLRILRQTDLPLVSAVRVLGVDDWAFKKGREYGTILVDLEQQRPVDLLPDRTAETLTNWLQIHPGIAVICRDRSREYKAGITQGAPHAIQVADRWHLLSNLGDALQRLLDRHPKVLRTAARTAQAQIQGETAAPPLDAPQIPTPSPADSPEPAVRTYRQARFAEVKALAAKGFSRRAIAHQLLMHRTTVARYLQLDELPKRVSSAHTISKVTPYLDYIQQRWSAGCHNGKQLWREICALGYSGSYMSVYRALQKLHPSDGRRQRSRPLLSPPAKLSPRQAMWLLVRPPNDLSDEEQAQLAALCEGCPAIAIAYPLAQRFIQMIRQRQAQALNRWLSDALASGIGQLRRFAKGLQLDYDAVYAALCLPWSNGQTEGQVNRLKVLKRMMYGRAKFDLLRLRVLHPP